VSPNDASPRPDRFALRILLFRARRNFFQSSPGACSQATICKMKNTKAETDTTQDDFLKVYYMQDHHRVTVRLLHHSLRTGCWRGRKRIRRAKRVDDRETRFVRASREPVCRLVTSKLAAIVKYEIACARR